MGAMNCVPCCCVAAEAAPEPAFRARGGAEPLLRREEGSLALALREEECSDDAADGGDEPQFLANPVPTVYKFVKDLRKRPTGPLFVKPVGGGTENGAEGAPASEPRGGAALASCCAEPSAEQPIAPPAPGPASLLGLQLPWRFAGPAGGELG